MLYILILGLELVKYTSLKQNIQQEEKKVIEASKQKQSIYLFDIIPVAWKVFYFNCYITHN